MKTNKEKQEFWRKHASALNDSGLSLSAYCGRTGLNQHTFQYWRIKFRKEKRNKVVAAAVTRPNFVRVLPKVGPTAAVVEQQSNVVAKIDLGGGKVFECLSWPDPRWLECLSRVARHG